MDNGKQSFQLFLVYKVSLSVYHCSHSASIFGQLYKKANKIKKTAFNSSGNKINVDSKSSKKVVESTIARIQNDFLSIIHAVAEERLDTIKLQIDPRHAATVMLVAGGYPGDYKKGQVISFD